MERKVWIFAAIGFVGALAFYKTSANHSAVVDGGRLNRLARLNALLEEGKTEYRPSFFRKRSHAKISEEKVAGLDPVLASETKAPDEKDAKAKADQAKKDAEKKAAAEKKKKEDEKKKKKKKKSKGRSDSTPNATSSDEDEKDASKDDGAGAGADFTNGGGAKVSADEKKPGEMNVDEWTAYLINSPSFDKLQKFIQLRQIDVVKADVFYTVVERMLLHQNEQLHSYAAMALDSTPSVQSLTYLYEIKTEPSMNAKVRSATENYLEKYGRVEYVRLLGAVISGTSQIEGLSNYAVNLIQKTASQNLTPVKSASATPANPGELEVDRAPAASITKLYEQLAAALHSVATRSSNSTLVSQATSAAQTIDSLLNTIGTSSTKQASAF